jgi:hypothetical protein
MADDAGRLRGGCFCGAVRYSFDAVVESSVCHCTSCRRVVGAVAVAWVGVPRTSLRFDSDAELTSFSSSEGVVRQFCARCGTHVTYQRLDEPETVDVTTASLDNPALVPPDRHIWVCDAVEWDVPTDGLPVFDTFAPDDGDDEI